MRDATAAEPEGGVRRSSPPWKMSVGTWGYGPAGAGRGRTGAGQSRQSSISSANAVAASNGAKALGPSASGQDPKLLGYAYWTTEIEPLERGFDGPIKMLVGMDTAGLLTGIIVTEHREPYGYFSVETPEFVAQFKGKNIRDKFQVGADVDAIARATITVTSSSRAIRNSSRRIARAYLAPPAQQ